jgi:superfamily II DNA/RNA helicase
MPGRPRATARPAPSTRRRPTRGSSPFRSDRGRGGATTPYGSGRSSGVDALELALSAASVEAAPAPTTFAALGLPDRLVTVLARRGLHAPFAIQARAIPDALSGRDILGRAQTGSGKTLAFGLPMLARLLGGARTPGAPTGLVLVPTRELAEQVKNAIAPLAHALDVRVSAIYGGASMKRQVDALRRGVDIVVATPGRLTDLIGQGECSLGRIAISVIDEADYMADLGFLPAVTELLDQTPAEGQRMLFSATLDRGVDRLVTRFLTDPALHAVNPAGAPVSTMDHRAFTVHASDKGAVAAEIATRPGRTLFFVRTKQGADRLAQELQRTGVDAAAIHGDLPQSARRRALEAFSGGHSRVLVATDVAARGLHVDDLDLVVHFDPPADHKDYLHRSGRTARAGADGVVLSLVVPAQLREVSRLHERAGVTATSHAVTPGHAAVREIATSGVPIVPTTPAPRPASARPRGRGGYQGVRGGRRDIAPRGDRYPRSPAA